jgi:uncharacterized protein (DUF433 family)
MDGKQPQDHPSALPRQRIESTSGVCGGRPRIAGTRISVQDVYVWHELLGKRADEIVASFPQLTPADVYAALTYYWDHRDELHGHMRDAEALVDELKAKHCSALRDKLLAGKNATGGSLSS